MSTQNAPLPPMSPTREVVREVSIPLVLITLGVLYLMDYAGGPSVRQTWPILLIVGGVAWSMTHFLSD